MRRIVRLASLGFACLGAIQAAIAAPIYRVQEFSPRQGTRVHASADSSYPLLRASQSLYSSRS